MKVAISAAGLLLATTSVSGYLWPIPREHSLGSKVALVSSNLTIAFSCESDILSAASQRYQDTILKRTFKPPTQYNSTASGTEDQFSKLLVKVHNCQATYPTLEDDESYNLTIPDPVPATEGLLEANTVWGALRGLETFSQLTYTLSNKQLVIGDLPVAITDSPAYPHRGLMLDTARNYFPVDDIKRTLDAMSYNKFNVFHWHIIDAQSWPVESKFLPDLYLKGAYDSDMTYSHRDVQDIIDYARDRGIRVVPEFEMPGHLSVVHHAKPEIMTCVNSQPHWDLDSAEPPSGQLNPLLPETYTFTQDLVNEYSGLFKDQFFHTGNDEVNTHCWNTTESIRDYLEQNNKTMSDILGAFVQKAHGYVRENNKLPMIWEEAVLDFELDLAKDTVVQVWRGAENTAKVVKKGYRALANSYEYWYLDCGHGTWVGNNPGGASWCDPFKHWQRVYSYDPVANLTTPEEQQLVLGGDVCLWTEQTDPNNLDAMLWPRAAAAAEVLWSGKDDAGKMRSVKEALVRIQDQRFRLVARGIRAEPLQPLWCARNPGDCDLPPPAVAAS